MSLEHLTVTSVSLRGNGLSQQDGVTFETPFVLQDEVYIPHIISNKGSRAFCLPEKIVEAAPDRITSDCKHFGICGACHFRHLSYADSVALKERLLRQELALLDGTAGATVSSVPAPDPLHYRNNARFYVKNGRLTQNKMLTHGDFVLEECYVVTPSTWRTAFGLLPHLPPTVTEIEIRENRLGEQMIILSGTGSVPAMPAHSAYFFDIAAKTFRHLGGAPYLTHYLHIEELDFAFAMGPESFFQVHTAMAELLYGAVAREVPMAGLLYDLYAGTGTMGIIMAKLFPKLRVVSVERNEEMVEVARPNADLNGVSNVTFSQDDVRTLTIKERPDCIIVDPPRNGLEAKCLQHLLSLGAEKIIYVSCNPETFIRDTEEILKSYALRKVTMFDMTPYTSHMEVLGVFERL